MERRLAAILAADMVGYSRHMEADEAGTLARLRALRAELIAPRIEQHPGRIVKSTGDGVLVEFGSVVDALESAVEIQRDVTDRNKNVTDDRRVEFRVGVNLGEIIVEDDDIYGTGVNIAARLQTIAAPGGICISQNVYEQIQSTLSLNFRDMGEQQVKNIARPIHNYSIDLDGGISAPEPAGTETEGTVEETGNPSIAVLPFDNMSADPEQEYFADGISEDIITALSKISGLFVIARNSTFAYKGKAVDVRQVSRDRGVRCVLEGSVRKSGNRVRITGQLIDAKSGERAIALEPGNADITALHAMTLNWSGRAAESLSLIDKAMRLSPLYSAWYLAVKAHAFRLVQRFDEAAATYRESIARNPDHIGPHIGLTACYAEAGDVERARIQADRLLSLNPDFTLTRYAESLTYRDPARSAQALSALRGAGLPE